MTSADVTGLGMRFGTSEEGRSWRGRVWERRFAAFDINRAMILDFCALVEDPNPAFWDGDHAPWGLLMTWSMPLPWQPGGARRPSLAALEVPLPGHHIINVATDTQFLRPLRVGERVSWVDELVDVSDRKRTRLGAGHFITTRTTYAGTDQQPVAVNTNVIYRYDVPDEPDAALSGAEDGPVEPSAPPGLEQPPVPLEITYRRVVHNAAATWDWYPGHHNPDYARSQGQRTIYLSTLLYHGLIDRAVGQWLGPQAIMTRREIRMQRSIYAGQSAVVRGWRTDDDRGITVHGHVASEQGAAVSYTVEAHPNT